MSKYLKLNSAIPLKDGNVEINFWDADKEGDVTTHVVGADVISFGENEILQKRIDELTAELEKVKSEKDVLRGYYKSLLEGKDRRIEELKERICIMSGEKDSYKECVGIIVDKICENMG